VILTACIPTVPGREHLLSRLLFTLTRQSFIEVLVAPGEGLMGDKVNTMFAAAKSKYVAVIDDDDTLAANYITALIPFLRYGPDFVGHDIVWTEDGEFRAVVSHCLEGDPLWRTFDRGVSPKCPVRTEIARRHTFGNDYTADRPWSLAVHCECKTGGYVPAPLYHYDHWTAERPDVGVWPYDESVIRCV
jgi:hypothetical protein